MISTAVDIICVVIDHGSWQSNVSAHRSGKDQKWDEGTPYGSVFVLARDALNPGNLLRFLVATVAEGRQTRQKIQMYLLFQKILQITLVCGSYGHLKILSLRQHLGHCSV